MHGISKYLLSLKQSNFGKFLVFNKIHFKQFSNTSNSSNTNPEIKLTDYEKENINLFNDIQDWWNPEGNMKLLHVYNSLRLKYVKDILDNLNIDLKSKRCLDIGCGGGLFTESLGRLGSNVTGIDPNVNSYNIASNHLQRYMGKEKEYLM
jgi:2-polyprenyl-3-methyl-5-hydroxy-6-metoxy-1,4-benzoquinol methylase